MEEISNMNFDHLSFSTFMKRLSNWVLNDGIDMGVKLIIGVLVIAIGFKIINNISKKFLKFAELKAVDVTIVKFLKSCINISLKCMSKTKMSLEENLRLFLARIQFLHSLSYFPSHYSITSSHTFDFNFIYLI